MEWKVLIKVKVTLGHPGPKLILCIWMFEGLLQMFVVDFSKVVFVCRRVSDIACCQLVSLQVAAMLTDNCDSHTLRRH